MSDVPTFLTGRGFLSEAAQARAKGVLVEVTGQAPEFNWTYSAERLARNMTGAILQIEDLARALDPRLEAASPQTRVVAEVWESLAKLQEGASRELSLLNAAAAYELAGYQANAACMARSVYRPQPDVPPQTVQQLALTFLQRFLLQTRQAAVTFELALRPEGLIEDLAQSLSEALLARALSEASRFLLAGDTAAYERAEIFIERATAGFSNAGLAEQANLASVLQSLLPVMRGRATWTILQGASSNVPMWNRYMKLLSRGPGRSVLRSPSVSELWPSQIEAVARGLLASGQSKVVRMPTSAGKTRVAETAIAHALLAEPGSKCVYIAPYRALAGEIEEGFVHIFSDLGIRVSSVLGTYESDAFEQMLVSDAQLLVLTPEKLDLLHRLGTEALQNVRLVVVDEGHVLDDQTRGLKFELLMTRLKRRLPRARYIFLSAVVPDVTLRELAQWLAEDETAVISSAWRPTISRVARFQWQGAQGVIRYTGIDDADALPGFVPGVIRQQIFERESPRSNRIRRVTFPDPTIKAQTAAELAYKFAEVGSVLVFCPDPRLVDAVGKALLTRIELAAEAQDLPGYFSSRETVSSAVTAEWLGVDHLATRLASKGIGLHHGRLPFSVRRAIEGDVRSRHLRIVVATNTLAQGVNLPIRTVIIHSCWRRDATGGQRISARDYWNIAGRAGRARQETEGLVVHIVFNSQDNADFSAMLRARDQLEPVRSALLQMLQDVASGRLTEAAAAQRLDPEVLALMVEEGITSSPSDLDQLAAVVSDSLAGVQAQEDIPALTKLLGGVVHGLEQQTTPESRRMFSPTGLRSDSCRGLEDYVREHEPELRRLFEGAGPGDLSMLARMAVEAAAITTEGQPRNDVSINHFELLETWLLGTPIDDLTIRFAESATAQELTGFIEDFCGYRLPWITGALLRLAADLLPPDRSMPAPYLAFLPAMIRSGVPTPEATWALAVGVQSRSAAIEISQRYLTEVSESSYQGFAAWLGSRAQDSAEPAGSEDAQRSIGEGIARSVANPYLVDFQGLDRILPLNATVRGTRFAEGRTLLPVLRPGESAELRRDYDNLIDRNAIEVVVLGRSIGYLPRDLAQVLAPELDTGSEILASVAAIEDQERVILALAASSPETAR